MRLPADILEMLSERGASIPPTNGHPSPLGAVPNGERAADHGPRGRFVRGNKAAVGRAHGRRVAELRRALLDTVTPATLKRLTRKLVKMAEGGDLDAAKLLLLYTLGRPAEATDPDKVPTDEFQRLTRMTRQHALTLLSDALNPGLALEALATLLGLSPAALRKSLFADTAQGLQIQVAMEVLADQRRGFLPVEMGYLVVRHQWVARLALLLDDLADEKTTPVEAMEQAEAVCGVLQLLDRACALDSESGGTRFLAPSLRAYIAKLAPVATTPEHRKLLHVLSKTAERLETPTGAQGQ